MLVGGEPNALHYAAAAGLGRGAAVWTTNFDELIETAATHQGIDYHRLLQGDEPSCSCGHGHLVKVHGTISGQTIAARSEDVLQPLDEAWVRRLRTDFAAAEVAVVGYAGADIDLRTALRGALAGSTIAEWFEIEARREVLSRRFGDVLASGRLHLRINDRPDLAFLAWAAARGLAEHTPAGVDDATRGALVDVVPPAAAVGADELLRGLIADDFGDFREARQHSDPREPEGVHARPSLGRLVAVELRKMIDTRAGFWLLAAVAAITVVAVAVRAVVGDVGDHDFQSIMSIALQPAAALLGQILVDEDRGLDGLEVDVVPGALVAGRHERQRGRAASLRRAAHGIGGDDRARHRQARALLGLDQIRRRPTVAVDVDRSRVAVVLRRLGARAGAGVVEKRAQLVGRTRLLQAAQLDVRAGDPRPVRRTGANRYGIEHARRGRHWYVMTDTISNFSSSSSSGTLSVVSRTIGTTVTVIVGPASTARRIASVQMTTLRIGHSSCGGRGS